MFGTSPSLTAEGLNKSHLLSELHTPLASKALMPTTCTPSVRVAGLILSAISDALFPEGKLIAVALPNVIIEDVEIITKSYPEFWNDLEKVGFELMKVE